MSSVSTLVSTSQIARSKICLSPQARFLITSPTSNYKIIKFRLKSACDYNFHELTIEGDAQTPLAKHILYFLTARRRSKENLSIPGITQENLELTEPPDSFDKHQKLKDEILDPPCVTHP